MFYSVAETSFHRKLTGFNLKYLHLWFKGEQMSHVFGTTWRW